MVESCAVRHLYQNVLVCMAGSALPPRHLQVHALTQTELLGHASPVSAVLPNEGLNSVASLGSDGSLFIWRLSPLQPLLSLTLPRYSAVTELWPNNALLLYCRFI